MMFMIKDITVPSSINMAASELMVECNRSSNALELATWLSSNGRAMASDDCSDVMWRNDYNASNLLDDCSATGSVVVMSTAMDDCGNSASTMSTFAIEDTMEPTIMIEASDETVECDGSGNTADLNAWLGSNGGVTVTDACSKQCHMEQQLCQHCR